jgi:hypothetical protein
MGVDVFNVRQRAFRPRREIEGLKTDIRAKTQFWLVVRRVNAGAYDIMGAWVDTNDADAETLAVSTCLDDSYFCGPFPVNVALPEKPVPWRGSYCPTKRARALAARKLAHEREKKAKKSKKGKKKKVLKPSLA